MSAGSARADGYDPLGNSPISNVPGSVSIFGGILTGDSSLGNLFIHPNDIDYENFGKGGFVGAAMSRQLVRFWSYFWLEAELGGGFRFEPGRDYYSPEGWGAIYMRFDGFPWNHYLRTSVGISTGINVIGEIPPSETVYGEKTDVADEAILQHYLSPEIAFSLPDSPQNELFFRIHHRSTGFGLFWNTSTGSNVLTLGLRFRR